MRKEISKMFPDIIHQTAMFRAGDKTRQIAAGAGKRTRLSGLFENSKKTNSDSGYIL